MKDAECVAEGLFRYNAACSFSYSHDQLMVGRNKSVPDDLVLARSDYYTRNWKSQLPFISVIPCR